MNLLCALLLSAASAAPVQVLVLGTFHMANPGHDLHNLVVDDVLAPRRQGELAGVTAALARFAPTLVAVEWPRAEVTERYRKYLDQSLPPSRNETVQLGFRLARAAKARVEGIDADGDFPYEPVAAWAGKHGRGAELEGLGKLVESELREEGRVLAERGIGGALRLLNDPARIFQMHSAFYPRTLQYGAGDEQPGVDLLTAWYRRNFRICANLAQQVKPGDRVVVLYGAGHAHLLRQCVREMPDWKLVEAVDYLPGG